MQGNYADPRTTGIPELGLHQLFLSPKKHLNVNVLPCERISLPPRRPICLNVPPLWFSVNFAIIQQNVLISDRFGLESKPPGLLDGGSEGWYIGLHEG